MTSSLVPLWPWQEYHHGSGQWIFRWTWLLLWTGHFHLCLWLALLGVLSLRGPQGTVTRDPPPLKPPGTQTQPQKLCDLLGSAVGGMGSVPRAAVATKVIHTGPGAPAPLRCPPGLLPPSLHLALAPVSYVGAREGQRCPSE